MERDETPVWAQELRQFTEFSLGTLERRLNAKMDSFENRVTRKIDNTDLRIGHIEDDIRELKSRKA
jgi:hypothetical protein